MNDRALEVQLERLFDTGANERDIDRRSRFAQQQVLYLLRGHAFRADGVDQADLVAFEHAAFFGRSVVEDFSNGHVAVEWSNLHTQPGITSVGVARKLFHLLGREEFAVGIVELGDQAARGFLVQDLLVERIDEPFVDELQHLSQQLAAVTCGARLKRECSAKNGEQHNADQSDLFGANHAARLTKEGIKPGHVCQLPTCGSYQRMCYPTK